MKSPRTALLLSLCSLMLAACGAAPGVAPSHPANGTARAQAAGSTVTGDVRDLGAMPSRFLKQSREVWIYLPPGYTDPANAARRYPVLYMHDGNNAFDASIAFGGNEWHADETAESLITQGQIPPVVLVFVGNTADRIAEYTWTPGQVDGQSMGGEGPEYAQYLTQELKPYIDGHFRTKTGPEDTGVLGSSLGGLISFDLGLHDSATFHKIGAMSPSFWWNGEAALHDVSAMPRGLKIWLDIGDQESSSMVDDAHAMKQSLIQLGYQEGQDLGYFEDANGGHNELAWAYRFPMALKFLLGDPASGRLKN